MSDDDVDALLMHSLADRLEQMGETDGAEDVRKAWDQIVRLQGATAMPKWEYRRIALHAGSYQDESIRDLNSAGSDGWEVCFFYGEWIYLKRPTPAQEVR